MDRIDCSLEVQADIRVSLVMGHYADRLNITSGYEDEQGLSAYRESYPIVAIDWRDRL